MSSGPSVPETRDPAKDYAAGIDVQLKNLPRELQAEQDARSQYDPQRIQQQQLLQYIYGPTQYAEQLDALNQLDPQGQFIRNQLGQTISSDLRSGYGLPADYDRELTNQIRGAQAARGGNLGTSGATAEAAFKGKAALDLHQQHIQNAGNYLSGPTPEQQISLIQGVSPDRTSAYTNPNAGLQGIGIGQQNYQNQLAAFQLAGGGRNPWASGLAGAGQGAAAGYGAGGGYGAAAGAILGGIGGYFSDAKTKSNIRKVGQRKGLGWYEFEFVAIPGKRFRGVLADEVEKLFPECVVRQKFGLLKVLYDKLGLHMQEVR